MTEEDWSCRTVEGAAAPASDKLDRLIGVAEAEMRAPVRALEDQDVGFGHEGLDPTGLPQLDVACVEDRRTVVLEVQLRRPEHVSCRVQRHAALPTSHPLAEAEHPPPAWP